jgi:hypothetical protein
MKPDWFDKAVELYNSGMTFVDVANQCGVSNVTIRNWFRKLNIPVRSHSDAVKISTTSRFNLDDEQIAADYESGSFSLEDLAEKNNVTVPVIRKRLKEQGVAIRKPGEGRRTKWINTNPIPEGILQAYTEGATFSELSKEIGLSVEGLRKQFKRHGIEIRPRSESALIGTEKGVQTKLRLYGYAYYPQYRTSKGERELLEALNGRGFNFQKNQSVLKNGLELDGFDQQRMVAIEYNGLFWHSEAGFVCSGGKRIGKAHTFHYNKYQKCRELGIKLYNIFEDEWRDHPDKVINYIMHNSGLIQTKIAARKTKFIEIPKETAREMVDRYHLQGGRCSIQRAFGLEYEGALVNVMTFTPHHRDTVKMSMNRFCGVPGLSVVGGASKLMKNAHDLLQSPIHTWSDNRWSNGNVYERMGCRYDGDVRPDYYWTDTRRCRFSKQSRKKTATGQPADMTEKEYNESLGLSRIWDCGKMKWVYGYE